MNRILIAAGLAAVLLVGCQSGKTEGQKKTEGLQSAVGDLAKQLTKGKTVLGETLNHYKATVSGKGDMIGNYKKFNNGIDDVEKQVAKIREANREVENAAAGVWTEWERKANKISDPDLKQASMDRMKKIQDKFKKIDREGDEARTSYEALMSELKSHRDFMGTGDINQESVKILSKKWPAMQKNAKTVNAFLDKMVKMCNSYVSSSKMAVKEEKKSAVACGCGETKSGCGCAEGKAEREKKEQ